MPHLDLLKRLYFLTKHFTLPPFTPEVPKLVSSNTHFKYQSVTLPFINWEFTKLIFLKRFFLPQRAIIMQLYNYRNNNYLSPFILGFLPPLSRSLVGRYVGIYWFTLICKLPFRFLCGKIETTVLISRAM